MNHSKNIEVLSRLDFIAPNEDGKPARLKVANGNVVLVILSDEVKIILTTGNGLIISEVRISGVDSDGLLFAVVSQIIRENSL